MKPTLTRLSVALILAMGAVNAQAQATLSGGTYSQNFDTLSNTAGSTTNTALPTGWRLTETGGGARDNEQYAVDTGSGNTGDTFSYGAAAATDRAFGGLQSGTLIPVIGACFSNATGNALSSFAIAYTGEQWRLGTTARTDQLDFQYSLDATSLVGGTWVDVNALDFATPNTVGTAGARDGNAAGNRTALSSTVSGVSIASGGVFCIRWNDANATGADDGLAIDDFSLTIAGTALPTMSINDVSQTEGNAGTTSFTFTVSLSSPAGEGGVTFDIATADGTATSGSDYIASSLTGQTIPAGSSSYSFSVTVNGETAVEGNEGFLVNISNVVGATVGDASGLGTILNDDANAAPIHDIQGNGSESPLDGTDVVTTGIVTAKRSNGFFLQTPDASADADPMTSQGIFVFTGGAPSVNVGDSLQVTGTVDEFAGSGGVFNMPSTQLQPSNIVFVSSGNPLPAAVEITASMLGANSVPDVLEHLEGMRASVASGKIVAQSPGNTNEDAVTSNDLNGEFEIVIAGVQRPLREAGISIFDPYAPVPVTVPLFDANQERLKVYPLVVPPGGTPRVDAGGTVSNLVGVLTYFGSNFAESAWELLYDAASPPTIVSGTPQAVADATGDDVTIAGFNMLRLFDDVANGSGPTISTVNFDKRVTKAAAVICDWLKTPDILGAVEVENLNAPNALAAKLNSTCASTPNYVAYLQEGNDVGGIDVGFLVNTRAAGAASRVQVIEIEQHGKTTTWTEPGGGTSLLNDRPPLRVKALVTLDDGRSYPITAIVVHQRSLNGNDATGSSGDRVRAKRAKQAEFVAQLVDDLQTANPDEKIVLVGDFNAFDVNDGYVDAMGITTGNPAPASEVVFWADSPLSATNGGTPLIMGNELIADPEQRYSYIFGNITQSLDHAVVNEALAMDPGVSALIVDHARVNADFRHGHFANFNPPYTTANPPLRTSDHDPVRVLVRLAADTAPPAISYTLDPASPNGSNGWYTGNVLVDWTVIDPETTITSSTGCNDTTLSSDTIGATFTCTATSAGGTSSVTTTTIKRDATAPTLAPTTPSPLLRGRSYVASPNASDATSGVASASCGPLDTSTTGNKSTSCTATDNAGNARTVTLNYTVITTCANDGYTGTKLSWCMDICERGYTGATLQTYIHRWTNRYRDLPYCLVNPQPQPTLL